MNKAARVWSLESPQVPTLWLLKLSKCSASKRDDFCVWGVSRSLKYQTLGLSYRAQVKCRSVGTLVPNWGWQGQEQRKLKTTRSSCEFWQMQVFTDGDQVSLSSLLSRRSLLWCLLSIARRAAAPSLSVQFATSLSKLPLINYLTSVLCSYHWLKGYLYVIVRIK